MIPVRRRVPEPAGRTIDDFNPRGKDDASDKEADRHPGLAGAGSSLGLPALAEAAVVPQPDVTRQREACAAEPPFYSTVRRNYFGYYPTCWSKFPDGWGCPCPNPELPNRDRRSTSNLATRSAPTDPADSDSGEMPATTPAGPAARPGDDPGSRRPDSGRSPFNTETAPPDNVPRRNVPDGARPPAADLRTPAAVGPPSRPTTAPTRQPRPPACSKCPGSRRPLRPRLTESNLERRDAGPGPRRDLWPCEPDAAPARPRPASRRPAPAPTPPSPAS